MLKRDYPVVMLGAWIDACSYWRLYMPHLNFPGSSFFTFAGKPDYSVITGKEVCVVQRCCTESQVAFLRVVSDFGLRIIYDLDDNVWELPKYNPAEQVFAKYRNGFNACMQMVDVITVSTRQLARAVKKHVPRLVNTRGVTIPVVVAENRMDRRLFSVPVEPSTAVVVGWAGSDSHRGDLPLAEKAMHALAASGVAFTVEYRGYAPTESGAAVWSLPSFRFMPWTPVAEYGARMPRWGWSIALAPVQDNSFNASKSSIKMVEAGYCGIPCLASDVRPYADFCSRGSGLSWLLCNTPGQWERKLKDLVCDPALRAHYGTEMRRVVDAHYTFDTPHLGWAEAFELARG